MSSDDIRYARRSDAGAADDSEIAIGGLAATSIEFMVTLTPDNST
jgi:hypothetical protein